MTDKKVIKKRRVYTSSMNRFGHKFGAISERIDRCLLVSNAKEAMTLEQIALKCDCNIMRVRSHLNCLKFGKRNFSHSFNVRLTKDKRAYMIACKSDITHYDITKDKRIVAESNFECISDE